MKWFVPELGTGGGVRSRPVRGAWIEMTPEQRRVANISVAPRKGRVD